MLFIKVLDVNDGIPACLAVVKDPSELTLDPVLACQVSVKRFMEHLGSHDLVRTLSVGWHAIKTKITHLVLL